MIRRHWRRNWPFYAVMVPALAVMGGLTYWDNHRVDADRDTCAEVGAVAVQRWGDGYVCVEVVAP